MNKLIISDSFDPWHNLAVEELLFDAQKDGMTLYLWQNRNTVVIGRHQNAWKECRHELLSADGGRLARRTTGGGAVFHDLGNLNFTFVTNKSDYDLTRQLSLIIRAAAAVGVSASFTGRNDVVSESGAKFSGNAFRFSRETGMHHGTILISADMDKLAKYLVPSAEKLRAKGVDSVRSRVCNLSDISGDASVESVKAALIDAFLNEYGEYELLCEAELDALALKNAEAKHASWEWRLGASPSFDVNFTKRFSWGELDIQLSLESGVIKEAVVYSDAMDESFITLLSKALVGVRMDGASLAGAIRALDASEACDAAEWLETVSIV